MKFGKSKNILKVTGKIEEVEKSFKMLGKNSENREKNF